MRDLSIAQIDYVFGGDQDMQHVIEDDSAGVAIIVAISVTPELAPVYAILGGLAAGGFIGSGSFL